MERLFAAIKVLDLASEKKFKKSYVKQDGHTSGLPKSRGKH
jgi:hypothetical protein